eukprot:326936-Prorocentrum_minimum.AAC.1
MVRHASLGREESVGPLHVRSWGAFKLKGISVPVSLATLSMQEQVLSESAEPPSATKWEVQVKLEGPP